MLLNAAVEPFSRLSALHHAVHQMVDKYFLFSLSRRGVFNVMTTCVPLLFQTFASSFKTGRRRGLRKYKSLNRCRKKTASCDDLASERNLITFLPIPLCQRFT